MTIREAEKVLVAATLEHTDGCISKAAAILGIDRSTLYAKIKRHDFQAGNPERAGRAAPAPGAGSSSAGVAATAPSDTPRG
jgi:hypothetical protein